MRVFQKSNSYIDHWGLSILCYNPQPTHQYDNVPIAIVIDSNDSDNGVSNSVDGGDGGGDGGGNGSGNGCGIEDGDSRNGGNGNKEVVATAMAEGANNNQSKLAAEKLAVMAATATVIAAGTNNNQLKAVVEKTVVMAMVVAMAALTTIVMATAARTTMMAMATATMVAMMATVEAVAAAAVVMRVATAASAHSATCHWWTTQLSCWWRSWWDQQRWHPHNSRETMACEEGEGRGNDAMLFAIVVSGGSSGGGHNRSIQASQVQQR
jgi:hypothetical protein